jgi:hypothetical protein
LIARVVVETEGESGREREGEREWGRQRKREREGKRESEGERERGEESIVHSLERERKDEAVLAISEKITHSVNQTDQHCCVD